MIPLSTAGAALGIGQKLIERLWPDAESKAEAQAKLIELQNAGALAQIEADVEQIKVNREQAKSSSMFVAGARPFIMWTCGVALAYHFLVTPVIQTILLMTMTDPPPLPRLDMEELFPILGGLLGLGAFRSYEKRHGVARESMDR